jgi:hypothetical protein
MALVLINRAQETATANTTVSFTLLGAVAGFQSFANVGNTNTTYYAATDTAGSWEVGIGTYSTTGPTLTRTTILASTNANAAVSTFSGTVTVFVTYPSSKSVNLDASGNVSALGTVASGVWNGTGVTVQYGGTGVSSLTANYIPYGNGTGAISSSANLTFDGSNLTVTGTGYSPNLTLTDASTVAWNTALGQVATFTFVTSNRTMGAPTNLVNGAFYGLAVIQNSGSNTLTWNSIFKWTGGSAPVLSTGAAAKDYFIFRSDGTNLYQQGQSLSVS